jgi:hypothetical protein
MSNINIPIPQDKIGENFVWRDWFQKLSNKVYGSMASQSSNNVAITGGTISGATLASYTFTGATISSSSINSTSVGLTTPAAGRFTTMELSTALSISYGGTGATTAANARTSLGLGTMATQSAGATGSFLSGDLPTAKTVTVVNGIITSIV